LVSAEYWLLRPYECYLRIRGDFYGNGGIQIWRVPLNPGDLPGGSNNYVTVSDKGRWKIFPCEGHNMARIGAGIDWIEMWEDDSHGIECCNDDFLGRQYEEYFNYFPREDYCPHQDTWYPTTLYIGGTAGAWIKFYDRLY